MGVVLEQKFKIVLENIHEVGISKEHIAEHLLKVFIAVVVNARIIVLEQSSHYL